MPAVRWKGLRQCRMPAPAKNNLMKDPTMNTPQPLPVERIELPELTPQQIEDALANTQYAGATPGHWVNDCNHVRLVPLGRVDGGPVYHLFDVKFSKNIQDGWMQNTQLAADAKLNAARANILAQQLAAMQPRDARAMEVVETLLEAIKSAYPFVGGGEWVSDKLNAATSTARQYINEMKG